jgi:hypothetical protein
MTIACCASSAITDAKSGRIARDILVELEEGDHGILVIGRKGYKDIKDVRPRKQGLQTAGQRPNLGNVPG